MFEEFEPCIAVAIRIEGAEGISGALGGGGVNCGIGPEGAGAS